MERTCRRRYRAWDALWVKEIPHFVLIAPDVRIQDVWQGYGKGSLLEKMEQNIK